MMCFNLQAQITERIEDLITVIFLPIYFTISGLKTQFGLIDSGILWAEVILLVFVAFISKALGMAPTTIIACHVIDPFNFLGGALPARYIAKFTWTEASIYGVLMSTKGLVALVSLNLGLAANIITSRFFAMLIMMVLLNTMIPGPLLALIYRIAKAKGANVEELQATKAAKYVSDRLISYCLGSILIIYIVGLLFTKSWLASITTCTLQ